VRRRVTRPSTHCSEPQHYIRGVARVAIVGWWRQILDAPGPTPGLQVATALEGKCRRTPGGRLAAPSLDSHAHAQNPPILGQEPRPASGEFMLLLLWFRGRDRGKASLPGIVPRPTSAGISAYCGPLPHPAWRSPLPSQWVCT
jgi:hypothetical protein